MAVRRGVSVKIRFGLGLGLALALVLSVLDVRDTRACSCLGPHDAIVGPDRVDDAPLNAKVRLEVAAHQAGRANGVALRVSEGATVDASTRSWPDGSLTFVELTPAKPLLPGTRYEIAIIDPGTYPSVTVLSTFKTGATADTTAPRLDAGMTATAKGNAHAGGGDCSIRGPWIEIRPVHMSDPGRPDAKLHLGVWLADAAGRVDTTKVPAALSKPYRDTVIVGQRSLCDPHDVALPKSASFVTLGIAAVDEAGNTSPAKTLRVDMRGLP